MPKIGPPRLKDIADDTGFSLNTVSLALRDSTRIPEITRDIIKQAAQRIGYRPNLIAQSLVSRQTRTIGLVMARVTNPVSLAVMQEMQLALAERGYATLFATSNGDIDTERDALDLFRGRQVDGIAVCPASQTNMKHLRDLRDLNVPLVVLAQSEDAALDSVYMDVREGSFVAMNHLLDLGHRKIAFLCSNAQHVDRAVRLGCDQAIKAHDLDLSTFTFVLPDADTVRAGRTATLDLLRANCPPSAVLAGTEALALGLLSACQETGTRVPDDLSVAVLNDGDAAAFARPPLTCISYPVAKMAFKAVDRLLTIVDDGTTSGRPKTHFFAPNLEKRASTAVWARPDAGL